MMGWQFKKVIPVAVTLVAAIGAFAIPTVQAQQPTSETTKESRQPHIRVRGTARTAVQNNPRADSLYRAAREAMVNGDPQTSIRLFYTLVRRYPKSQHATAALYYRAFLLYRQYQPGGQPAVLRSALTALRQLEENYPNAPQTADGRALQNRICGELGQLGDSVCRAQVVVRARPSKIAQFHVSVSDSTKASKGEGNAAASGSIVIELGPGVRVERDTSCHNEKELDSYVAALNSLWKVDSTRAIAAASEVLHKRDRCLTRLREQTLLIVMQRPAPVLAMTPVIFDVARNDPDTNVKKLATMWLLSQEWEPPTAQFLHSIFGQTFRVKTTAKAKETAESKRE